MKYLYDVSAMPDSFVNRKNVSLAINSALSLEQN